MTLSGAAPAQAQQLTSSASPCRLTGSQALYGADQVKAAQWAVDDINAKGGVNGKKLEMIVLDTQADPQIGINAVNRLISVEKVPVFITAWSVVVQGGRADRQRQQGGRADDRRQLARHRQARRLRLHDVPARRRRRQRRSPSTRDQDRQEEGRGPLHQQRHRHRRGARSTREVFTAAGGKVVAYEAYDPKATDFTGALLKVRAPIPT